MKLIKIESDYYLVSDEKIEPNDWFLINSCIVRRCYYVDNNMVVDKILGRHHVSVCKKITGTTDYLELEVYNSNTGEVSYLSEVFFIREEDIQFLLSTSEIIIEGVDEDNFLIFKK